MPRESHGFSPDLSASSTCASPQVKRIEHIVRSTGCRPQEVLAITFTRNACEEMKARLKLFKGGVVVQTIHSFCMRLLRAHLPALSGFGEERLEGAGLGECAGLDGHFSVANKREQVLMLEEALEAFEAHEVGRKGVSTQLPTFCPPVLCTRRG